MLTVAAGQLPRGGHRVAEASRAPCPHLTSGLLYSCSLGQDTQPLGGGPGKGEAADLWGRRTRSGVGRAPQAGDFSSGDQGPGESYGSSMQGCTESPDSELPAAGSSHTDTSPELGL